MVERSKKLFRKRERRALVVDEIKIRTHKGLIQIIVAIDHENREIVGLHVSKHREMLDVLQFLNQRLEYCEGRPVLITDGGLVLMASQTLGLEHLVLLGGKRNYIERWFKNLKNRLSRFNRYFPTKRLTTIRNFTRIFCLWYNQCRHHTSIKGPPADGKRPQKVDGGVKLILPRGFLNLHCWCSPQPYTRQIQSGGVFL